MHIKVINVIIIMFKNFNFRVKIAWVINEFIKTSIIINIS